MGKKQGGIAWKRRHEAGRGTPKERVVLCTESAAWISGISLPLASYLNGVIDWMIQPTALSTQESRWQTRTTKCSNFLARH